MATGRLKAPSCSVYFGRLDARVTSDHLRELGVQAGPVKRANRSEKQGFGFVEYEDVESAIYCVGLYHGLLKLFGNKVDVNFSNSPFGDMEPEAQKLLERCEQLLDIALSTDINAGAGAVRRGGRVEAQRYTPYGDARGHREQRTRAPTRFNDDDDYEDAAAGQGYGFGAARTASSYMQEQYAHPRPMQRQDATGGRVEPAAQQPYVWPSAAVSHVPPPAPLGPDAMAAMQAAASVAAAAAAAAAAGQGPAQVPGHQAQVGSWQAVPQSAPLQLPVHGSLAPSQGVVAVLQALVPQQQQQQQQAHQQPAAVQDHQLYHQQQYQQPAYQPQQQQQQYQYQTVQPVQAHAPLHQQYQQPAYQPQQQQQVYQQWQQEQQMQQQHFQAAPTQFVQQWHQQQPVQPAAAPQTAVAFQPSNQQGQYQVQQPQQQPPAPQTVVWYQ